MTERKNITDRTKWHSCLFWGEVKCPECGLPIEACDENIEWDHVHSLCFDGMHAYHNIRPMHATCHAQKTIRDVKQLAKVKRLEKERHGQPKRKRVSRKIKSAGFPKVSRPFPKRASHA